MMRLHQENALRRIQQGYAPLQRRIAARTLRKQAAAKRFAKSQ
jgi:hypothetical protein